MADARVGGTKQGFRRDDDVAGRPPYFMIAKVNVGIIVKSVSGIGLNDCGVLLYRILERRDGAL